MELTSEEKRYLIDMIDKHLNEVKETEKLPNQSAGFLGAEVNYEDFVEKLKKKLA